ncbi:twin-arginine translocase TatA/TatE family subunit [Conexibacter sp. DBS9H8]|uniref:Sec-independent protein translocase subunit TatA/TatB n=1 Tax=Conexibacter sp. DBS9H8 TaxID=2937801 RepID=UPI00201074B7|nr:twin-arginine translocase TatA/TatE family subunit [Conexibacter sp. DBS9H8]
MFGDILQPTHLIFIMLVALLVLGPKRLPEVGRSLGKGLRDFRSAMSGIDSESHDLFDSARVHLPVVEPTPEPVMATAASADEPSLSGAATEATPAVAPRNDDLA